MNNGKPGNVLCLMGSLIHTDGCNLSMLNNYNEMVG